MQIEDYTQIHHPAWIEESIGSSIRPGTKPWRFFTDFKTEKKTGNKTTNSASNGTWKDTLLYRWRN